MKTLNLLKMLLIAVIMLIGNTNVYGQLASWNASTLDGSTSFAASSSNDNVTVTPLVMGSGFGTLGGAANSFGAAGANQFTLAAAIADGDYFTTTIQAKPGYKILITGISPWRPSTTVNPTQIQVQYDLGDGNGFIDAGSIEVTSSSGAAKPLTFAQDVQNALANLTSATTVTFRFVVVVSSGTGTVYIARGADDTATSFAIAGSIVENNATLAQWNGYTPGVPPADGIFLAANGTAANNGIATLARGESVTSYTVPATASPNISGFPTSGNWLEGSSWVATFSTLGYEDLTVNSVQRSTNTGPRDFQLQYYDTTINDWVNVTGGAITVGNNISSGVLSSVALPAALNNQASVSLRWVVVSDFRVDGTEGLSSGTTTTNSISATVIGNIAVPALLSMTVKGWKAVIDQNDKTITVKINSQVTGFGLLSSVETNFATSDDETTLTIGGQAINSGNSVDFASLGLVSGITVSNIPVVLSNSTGTETDYVMTITDDPTATNLSEINKDKEVKHAQCYNTTGVEVDCKAAQGIVIKRIIFKNGSIETVKELK